MKLNKIEIKFAAIIFKAIQNINYQSDRKFDIVLLKVSQYLPNDN